KFEVEHGKYFARGELRYVPDKDRYQLTGETPAKEKLVFDGSLNDRKLTLERVDQPSRETQRLVVTLLHSNRYLTSFEIKPAHQGTFKRIYQVGATKEGEAFAVQDAGPECVVTGGAGTIRVTYNGKAYYVCCSGCRDAFKDNPEKFIKEYEERKSKGKKE